MTKSKLCLTLCPLTPFLEEKGKNTIRAGEGLFLYFSAKFLITLNFWLFPNNDLFGLKIVFFFFPARIKQKFIFQDHVKGSTLNSNGGEKINLWKACHVLNLLLMFQENLNIFRPRWMYLQTISEYKGVWTEHLLYCLGPRDDLCLKNLGSIFGGVNM